MRATASGEKRGDEAGLFFVGAQQRRPHGQVWGNPRGGREYGTGIERNDYPNLWGDLLLLGTDPRLAVQDADEAGTLTRAIVPGHSYLLTVIDPDRNVHLAAEDIVLVSAEVAGGPSQGIAVNPSQKASMGIETIFSSFTYFPSTSSLNPSSRFKIHHCMGT